jgi:hypothetical protein
MRDQGLVLLAAWGQWLAVVGVLVVAVRRHLRRIDELPQPTYRRPGSGDDGDPRRSASAS